MAHLFVSYSTKDEAVAELIGLLQARGLVLWQDDSGKAYGIPRSTEWFQAIEEAIHTASGAIVFCSPNWKKSGPCKDEFNLIKGHALPFFGVCLPLESGRYPPLSPGELADRIVAWAESEVYGSEDNEVRTWLVSSARLREVRKDRYAGMPIFKNGREAKEFVSRYERYKDIAESTGFEERDPKLAREISRFLESCLCFAWWNRIKRPLVFCIASIIMIAIAVVVGGYTVERSRVLADLDFMGSLKMVRYQGEMDEELALYQLGTIELDDDAYAPVLFEAYADLLDSEFPIGFYPNGTDDAVRVAAISPQAPSEECRVELSSTMGVVSVWRHSSSDMPDEMVSLRVSAIPTAFAVKDGYLAIASESQAYVFDVADGWRVVELSCCHRDIVDIRFDEDGRVCALTEAGDVYVWENPISRASCRTEPTCSGHLTDVECVSSDGSLKLVSTGVGYLELYDVDLGCIIWKSSSVAEPIEAVYLDEETLTVYALGRSGRYYAFDASSLLFGYGASDYTEKLASYRRLASEVTDRLVNKFGL